MAKRECPSCAMNVPEDSKSCPVCDYEFPSSSFSSGKWRVLMIILLLAVFLAATFGGVFKNLFD